MSGKMPPLEPPTNTQRIEALEARVFALEQLGQPMPNTDTQRIEQLELRVSRVERLVSQMMTTGMPGNPGMPA